MLRALNVAPVAHVMGGGSLAMNKPSRRDLRASSRAVHKVQWLEAPSLAPGARAGVDLTHIAIRRHAFPERSQ